MSLATLGAIAINKIPEAVSVMIFYQIGEALQKYSVKRSRNSIKSLLEIKPDYANLKINDSLVKVNPGEVKPGDIIIVKPGEKIPLDGKIIEGKSDLDTSPLTGESLPKTVTAGATVLAGMININGSITVKVTNLFENSSISKILELVENASGKKAETEKFITRFSGYYTPVVVLAALLTAVLPPLLFTGYTFSDWIYRALVILVISCPCALVISIPLGYFGGVGGASRRGILVKGSNFLDVLAKVKTVVFDKTGTLTKGKFTVTDIVPLIGYTGNEILKMAAEAEVYSNHPLSIAIKDAYGKNISEAIIKDYCEIGGQGVKAVIDGNLIIAGNDRMLHEELIDHPDCNFDRTIINVAVNKKYAGYIVVSDELKEDAVHTIRYLRKKGVEKIFMLTGDNKETASIIAGKLELDGFEAELLPQDKVTALERIMAKNKPGMKTAFIGDGINDAPVIARADVGIVMGAMGSDAAIETADVVIMSDKPSKVGTAIDIAEKTRKIIWQNIFFALGVKAFFIVLGAMGIASMWEAVFGDMGVAIIAILNSTRVLK
jgi:Cd2+/Zn2+-exporting ATPase